MSVIRLEVFSLLSNKRFQSLCREAREFLSIPLDAVWQVLFYKISSNSLTKEELFKKIDSFGKGVFYDPIIQKVLLENIQYAHKNADFVVEVSFKPGVTDNRGKTAKEALELLCLDVDVYSGELYFFNGKLNKAQASIIAKEFLANELIQDIKVYSEQEFKEYDRFSNLRLPEVVLDDKIDVREISLGGSDEDLSKISDSRCLALTSEEMKYIRDYYLKNEVTKERFKRKLPKFPTDVELEIIAQTWSEHCKHKIFNSEIEVFNETQGSSNLTLNYKSIISLYNTFIKGATERIEKERNIDWLISVFSDNAGIVRFDSNLDICIKVETHNSPSALDPYGGSLTGILGVNRDILGCGLGARPIANMDAFCFAPPDILCENNKDLLPIDLKHPRRILEGVHLGIEDGGNKSGIPTVNGAFYFDQDYAGKPLVFCGTVGVLPHVLQKKIPSSVKKAKSGDRVVMIGGEIGADGIHGATFSSLELNESSPATAVQIGDPLTQKRMSEFIIEARDLGLYSSITDNGAGGLSSSIGEMSIATWGVSIDLSLCPVKYPGLKLYELMISESQERMSLAVPKEKIEVFMALAKKRGVKATDIGEFNDIGRFSVFYKDKLVAELSLDFLFHSLPSMKLKASLQKRRKRISWATELKKMDLSAYIGTSTFFEQSLLRLLQRHNICSKERLVRRYDHEVGGGTHIKPFIGTSQSGPSDSGVIWLYPHGGERDNAITIGCGLAPRLSLIDSYFMAQYSVDEAIRNVVASGGNIDKCCLLDNFCWTNPIKSRKNPDGDYKLGQLVQTCIGLYDICCAYGTPLVSGKDSMKNDFRGRNKKGNEQTISILPTLFITAMAQTNILHTVTTDFKDEGDLIYILGSYHLGLAGSEFAEIYYINDKNFDTIPPISIANNKKLYQLIKSSYQKGLISSCHDISDGGLMVAICESMIGSSFGADIILKESKFTKENFLIQLADFLFNESTGRFVVSVKHKLKFFFEQHFRDVEKLNIGKVTYDKSLKVINDNDRLINISLKQIKNYWKRGL